MNQTLSTELLPEWQRIVDLIAHIAKVPVGLIMGLRDNTLTVLVSSRTKGNPYRAGETTSLPDSGLYCEHVIRSQQALQVPDALQSPQWDHNPDLARHMVAYLGFPVRYPDGTPFGTICLLDSKEHHFSQEVTELIERMRALIEGNLKMQNLLNQNAKRVSEIHEKNQRLEKLLQALDESEKKFRFITENTVDFIWMYNVSKRRFLYASPGLKQLTGQEAETLLTMPLHNIVLPQYLDNIKRNMQNAVRKLRENPTTEPVSQSEIQQYRVDGSAVWVEYKVKYLINQEGDVEAVGVSRNIEERKRREQEIRFLSTHDYLTKTHNRLYLYAEARKEIALTERSGRPLAMLFFDLDGFKAVNDQHGHAVGDAVLQRTTHVVMQTLRKPDVLARYGGEEFVVLMPDMPLEAAHNAAERIRLAVEAEPMPKGLTMTVSIGVAVRAPHESLEQWVDRADRAMYEAKDQGRNCCIVSSSAPPGP